MPAPPASDLPVTDPTLPPLQVRAAEPADLDALVALEQRSFAADRVSRAQYRRHLASATAAVLVATAGAHACLGAALVLFRRGSGVARLYSIASQPQARGRGIGAALLGAAEDAARQRGCHALRLEVRVDNPAAIGLYEARGYARIGGYRAYYADGADAWRYEKPLG